MDHLFINCAFGQAIWEVISLKFGIFNVRKNSIESQIHFLPNSCDPSKGGNIIEFFNNSKLPWQAVLKNIMWDQDSPISIWRFLNHWVPLGLFLSKDALFLEFIDLLFIKSRMPIGSYLSLCKKDSQLGFLDSVMRRSIESRRLKAPEIQEWGGPLDEEDWKSW